MQVPNCGVPKQVAWEGRGMWRLVTSLKRDIGLSVQLS